MIQEDAYRAYSKVRQSNPPKEIQLSENFEGCKWFLVDNCWTRENDNEKRVQVGRSRRGSLEVRLRFKHEGLWYTSERYSVDG